MTPRERARELIGSISGYITQAWVMESRTKATVSMGRAIQTAERTLEDVRNDALEDAEMAVAGYVAVIDPKHVPGVQKLFRGLRGKGGST